ASRGSYLLLWYCLAGEDRPANPWRRSEAWSPRRGLEPAGADASGAGRARGRLGRLAGADPVEEPLDHGTDLRRGRSQIGRVVRADVAGREAGGGEDALEIGEARTNPLHRVGAHRLVERAAPGFPVRAARVVVGAVERTRV